MWYTCVESRLQRVLDQESEVRTQLSIPINYVVLKEVSSPLFSSSHMSKVDSRKPFCLLSGESVNVEVGKYGKK